MCGDSLIAQRLHEPSSKRIPTIPTHSRVDHYKISSIWQINRERLPLIDDFIQLNVCFTHLRYLIGLMKMMMRNAIINGQWWHHFFFSCFCSFHVLLLPLSSNKKGNRKKKHETKNDTKNTINWKIYCVRLTACLIWIWGI